MTMQSALASTVAAIDPPELLTAAVELGRLYARQLDQAAAARAQADKALRLAEKTGDEVLTEIVSTLRAKLGERECVDRIGARLHALLVELQATPKSRGKAPTGVQGGALGALRAVRAVNG